MNGLSLKRSRSRSPPMASSAPTAVRVLQAPPTFCCTTAWAASAAHRGLWGFVRGGMGGVSNAIADSARASGAVIRTNAPVETIIVKNGRAAGVVLKGGEEILAPIVASNLDPRRTFLHLVEEAVLPADFVAGIRQFPHPKEHHCKMNLALNGLPEFSAFPGAPGPQHRATMHSARRSNTSSAPGTTPSTAVRRVRR